MKAAPINESSQFMKPPALICVSGRQKGFFFSNSLVFEEKKKVIKIRLSSLNLPKVVEAVIMDHLCSVVIKIVDLRGQLCSLAL